MGRVVDGDAHLARQVRIEFCKVVVEDVGEFGGDFDARGPAADYDDV